MADVFIQNLVPGAAARMGLSFEALPAQHPGLIVYNISGYGQDGPYRSKKAYDLLIQSEAGTLSVTGKENEAAKVGISIADIAAGMYAYTNVLAAILQRVKTGQSSHRHLHAGERAWWNGWDSLCITPIKMRLDLSPLVLRTLPYTRTDHSKQAIARLLCLASKTNGSGLYSVPKILNNADLATDAQFFSNSLRVENRNELYGIICQACSGSTAPEIVSKLDSVGIANTNVNDMQGVWNRSQLRARGR